MANPAYIDEGFARRLAKVLPLIEAMFATGNSSRGDRLPIGHGFQEIGVAVLTENLTAGGDATATLLRQNASTAAFIESESDDAEVTVYDSLDFLSSTDSEYLASGCTVVFWRNPATGFRNVIGSPCCPST